MVWRAEGIDRDSDWFWFMWSVYLFAAGRECKLWTIWIVSNCILSKRCESHVKFSAREGTNKLSGEYDSTVTNRWSPELTIEVLVWMTHLSHLLFWSFFYTELASPVGDCNCRRTNGVCFFYLTFVVLVVYFTSSSHSIASDSFSIDNWSSFWISHKKSWIDFVSLQICSQNIRFTKH